MNMKFALPALILAIVAPIGSSGTAATVVTVKVMLTGVRSDSGYVRGVLCADAKIFPRCKATHEARAKKGSTEMIFENVAPGIYAFEAFHDENDNKRLDSSGPGMLLEGFAYGNDAQGQFGPPNFTQASTEIAGNITLRVTMRYFDAQATGAGAAPAK